MHRLCYIFLHRGYILIQKMKIRTITTGFNLETLKVEDQIRQYAEFTNTCKKIFENNGYTVQTLRIATQPWEKYFESKNQIVKLVRDLELLAHKYAIDYFNIGTT